MDANELRIGNYAYENGIALPMNIHDINCIYKNYYHGEKYKPIPLTEEWLLKFGFKKWNSKGITYSKGVLIIHLRKRGFVINKRFVEPKHVHQLQNLYYALTGKELSIKINNQK